MKVVMFSDIHYGNHSNSDEFNQQCNDFLNFVKDWTDEHLQEPFITIFMGDWFHNRNTINVKTLNYAKEGLITLSNIGSEQYLILGNHDLYYRNQRDVSSVIIPEEAQGIEVIVEPIVIKDKLLLTPWLLEDETIKDLIEKHNPEYVFGHFEIPSFKFNQKVVCQGEYNPFDYQGPKHIYSGHFHTFSEKNNITYIGNCFSNDFSDTNDWHNKGFVILDTDSCETVRVEWKDAPKYLVTKLSEVENTEFPNNLHLRLINDTELDNDNINKLQQDLLDSGKVIECQVLPKELDLSGEVESIEMNDIGNMNVIIPDMLTKVDMEGIRADKLVEIYNNLGV